MRSFDLPELFATLMGGGVLGTLTTALVQGFRKPASQAEMITAAQNAAKDVIGELRTEAKALREKVRHVEGRCDLADEHRDRCESDLALAKLDLAEAKRRIDILMLGRIAQPGEPAPQD